MDGLSPSASTGDQLAVIDALLRFGAGTDQGDQVLLASAFTDEIVVDFSPCGRKLGLDITPLSGRDTVVGFLAGTSAQQVTSHVISNARVTIAIGGATLHALVDAIHIVRAEPQQRFQMMNRYHAELTPDQAGWRISRLLIDNVWFEGDPRTMLHR